MTVCIATIGIGLVKGDKEDREVPVIVAVADRMVTAWNIESEPEQSKINKVAPFVLALTAGDDSVQTEVSGRTQSHFRSELGKESRLFPVSEVADVYSSNLVAYIRQTIERTVLEPMGINWDTYINGHPEKHAIWFEEGRRRVFGNQGVPETQTIIAGIDETGAHIFVVDADGQILNQDSPGFATIGLGSWHAESQFLLERHSPSKPFSDTLLLSYVGKRRAEVAPGVGKDTDLVVISRDGGFVELLEELEDLGKIYEKIVKNTERETINLRKKIPTILEKAQRSRKAKFEERFYEKERKWLASGRLEDSPFKLTGHATFSKPGDKNLESTK